MPEKPDSEKYVGFNSFNCVDVYIDEIGDNTVRPVPPAEMPRVKELRDRLNAAIAAGINLSEQIVFVDEPGDNTVRPCDPKLLGHAMAERAKIQAALAAKTKES